ncbi:MAG: hypothetical protein P1V97_33575, partial [Planctomycetota bacterium]|nr:hypothetical protein [Planctomycetota bacterium]
ANSTCEGTMNLELKLKAQDSSKVAKKDDLKPNRPVTKVAAGSTRDSYKLSVSTSLKYKSGNRDVVVDTPYKFQYDNIAGKAGISVQFTEVIQSLFINGAESINIRLTKDGTVTRDRGKTEIEPYDKLDADSKTLLYSMFRKPIAIITTTLDGTELTRVLSDQHKAGAPFDATIHNLRWFHARFADEKSWADERTFDIGQSGTISGLLNFTKLDKKDASGNTIVKVSGTLTKAAIWTRRGTIKNAKYVFNGLQSYNEKRKKWVRGQTNVTLTYSLRGTPIRGTMTLKLELVKGQAKIKPIKPAPTKSLPEVKIDPAQLSKHSYQLSIDTTVTSQAKGPVMKITNPVSLRYTNSIGPKSVSVTLKEFKYHVLGNGRTKHYVEMDKDHICFHTGGKKQTVSAENADAKNKALLKTLFAAPIAQIILDKERKEISRKVSPGSIDGRVYDATIHNARWFHSRFAATKSWVETRTLDVSKGGFITGSLTFTKLDKKDGAGNTVVKVTGTLTQDRVNSLRGPLRDAIFKIEGTRSYDETRKIWVSGQSNVTMTYEQMTVGGPIKMAGTMTLKLTLENSEGPASKKAPDKIVKGPKNAHSYQLDVYTKLEQTIGKEKITVETPLSFRYDNIIDKNTVTVQFTDVLYINRINGAHNLLFKVNKEKTILFEAGKKPVVTLVDKVDPGTKAFMRIMFQTPLATIKVDKDGEELKRSLGPGAERGKTLDATIYNARWFHVRFAEAKNWVAVRTFDIGKGGTLSGPFTFTKLDKKDASGNTVVKIAGEISKDKVISKRGEMKNLKYVFSGTQSFDETRRIWVSGQTEVKLSFEMDTKNGLAKIEGNMILILGPPRDPEEADEKKAPEPKKAPAMKPALDLTKALHYQVTSKRVSRAQLGKDKADFLNELKVSYANQWQRSGISLYIVDYLQSSATNGTPSLYFKANQDLYHLRGEEIDNRFLYKETAGGTRVFLDSLFRSKYATVTVDRMGKEQKRQIHAQGGVRLFSSLIHNVRWFHPRYSSEKTWTENRVFECGEGTTISGPIKFTKLDKKDAAGNTVVTISGTMTKAEVKTSSSVWLDAKFVFEGKLSYDEKREIWVSGETRVKFSYKRAAGKDKIEDSGTETLTMKLTKK